jgi:hypothetical protein
MYSRTQQVDSSLVEQSIFLIEKNIHMGINILISIVG